MFGPSGTRHESVRIILYPKLRFNFERPSLQRTDSDSTAVSDCNAAWWSQETK